MDAHKIGLFGQWLAVAFQVAAIGLLIIRHYHLFEIFVVCGSLSLTLATKVRYYGFTLPEAKRRRGHVTIDSLIERSKIARRAS